jgi:Tfp pilus assembly protein PilF
VTVQAEEAYLHLGDVRLRQNRPAEAEQALKQALQADPEFVPAHQRLAQLFADQGRTAEALKHQREAERLLGAPRSGR